MFKSFKLLLIIIPLSLILNTCKKSPLNSNFIPNDILIATETIGNDGGTISDDNFSLSIPVESFNSYTDIILSYARDPTDRFDDIISEQYIIEGIPDYFNKPLKIAIKHNGSLTNETKNN
jgi:hypothetical protein